MEQKDVWEIRHPKNAGVVSSILNCGYPERTLESLRENGYSLYCNGTLVPAKKQKKGV